MHGCQCCTPSDDSEPPVIGCSAGCIVINYSNRRKLRLGDTITVEHHDPHKIKANEWTKNDLLKLIMKILIETKLW